MIDQFYDLGCCFYIGVFLECGGQLCWATNLNEHNRYYFAFAWFYLQDFACWYEVVVSVDSNICWSSIGRNLATVAVYNSVLILADTSRDYYFLFLTMLHVSGSFLMVKLEYLEAKVILWHTLVTDQIVTSMTTCICKANLRSGPILAVLIHSL